ncbi:MAG: MCE family protein [Candidatus Hydrogenedentota bacterium]|nr:MAG: MCE family protein [Candidatus Hydrogenedentota bacterium]
MKPKASELFAGLFVIFSVAVFLIFLSWMGGGFERWFAEMRPAVTWFNNIGGLKEQVEVTYQGVPIGKVEKITYDAKHNRIKVTMTIKKDFPIPEEAVAVITQPSLLSDPYIEITSDFRQIDDKLLVRGRKKIRKRHGVLEIDAIDPSTYGIILAKAGYILDDVRKFTRRLDGQSKRLGHILKGADKVVGDVRTLTRNFDHYSEQVDDILEGTRKIVADPAFRRNIHQTAANARDLTANINDLVLESRDTVTTILVNADETMTNARVLSYGLAESPWRLVWEDQDWARRVEERDPELLNASLKKPAPDNTSASQPSSASSRKKRRNPFAYH